MRQFVISNLFFNLRLYKYTLPCIYKIINSREYVIYLYTNTQSETFLNFTGDDTIIYNTNVVP